MTDAPDWTAAGFATRAVHAGQESDPATGAVVPPADLVADLGRALS